MLKPYKIENTDSASRISWLFYLKPENRIPLFLSGLLSSFAFAPSFFFPFMIIGISILLYYIKHAGCSKAAFFAGWIFGFGHFLSGLYWISLGVAVYIEQFWWALPFALCGLPIILAFFIAFPAYLTYKAQPKANLVLVFIFSILFISLEWVRSWIFTGLPWNLAGYSLCFSERMLQLASITGVYGLSFLVIFISGNLYFIYVRDKEGWIVHSLSSLFLLLAICYFGEKRLQENPPLLTDISVRLVQPSIPQEAKWDHRKLYKNMELHAELTKIDNDQADRFNPDLVIWSEAAVTLPLNRPRIKSILTNAISEQTILITGGVSEIYEPNNDQNSLLEEYRLYTSFYGINAKGQVLFNYNKAHLVPFGEYMPYKEVLGLKKITAGFIDYSPGDKEQNVHFNIRGRTLYIRPLVCYEAIFPDEARVKDPRISLFINITNDSWYGRSTGPYQHFEISRMRAIENGIPMIRVGNNGISGIIDPLGRVIFKTELDEISATDGFIPKKIEQQTLYSIYGNFCIITLLLFTIIVSYCIYVLCKAIKIRRIWLRT
ncbi:MAG: cutE [Rickettsiaceae bacterium]|jgi:apolipoprotein N-acyltransferase|nr:cutE [Rickettsiaceae bacterium]